MAAFCRLIHLLFCVIILFSLVSDFSEALIVPYCFLVRSPFFFLLSCVFSFLPFGSASCPFYHVVSSFRQMHLAVPILFLSITLQSPGVLALSPILSRNTDRLTATGPSPCWSWNLRLSPMVLDESSSSSFMNFPIVFVQRSWLLLFHCIPSLMAASTS